MPDAAANRSLELSQRLYGRLLAAYPRRHRQEYGSAMAQLFRDQCRDAWAAGRTWGLVALWLRTLPDLIKTSLLERFTHLNQWKFMSEKLNLPHRPGRTPVFVFCAVFLVVFVLTLLVTTAITFILPESYAATCRIKVEPENGFNSAFIPGALTNSTSYDPLYVVTAFEVIQSKAVLDSVVARLDLPAKWGKKYFAGKPLTDAACVELLKRRLELQPIRNTKLLAITVYSEDKKECADLANAVAWDYAVYRKESRQAIGRDELDALSRRYQDGEQQISQLQNELEQLRRKFNLSDTPGAEAGLLAKYQGQLVEQKMACQTLAAQFDKLTALDGKHLREVLPTVSPDSLLVDLLGKLNAAEQSYAGLTNDYASSDLHITRVRSSMDILNHQIDDRVDGLMAGLRANLANQREELASLQATVEDLDKTVQINAENTPEKQSYQAKKRHLETLLDFQKLLAAKLEAARLDLEISTTALVQIIDEAQPQNAPARPNKPLNILLGAIFGLLLGGVAGSIAAIIAHRVARPAPKPAAG